MIYYENIYQNNLEGHKEVRWKTLNWTLIICIGISMLLIILSLLVGGIYGIDKNNTPLAVYSFVMMFTFFACSLTIPCTVFSQLKTPKEYLTIESKFFDNEIQISASNGKSKIYQYNAIKKVKETKNFFILIFEEKEKPQSYLVVKKDSFKTGTKYYFTEFLWQRKKQVVA